MTAVLVEEAAQLVEAHVLAAMPSSTQRLIMIGDHKQLRPGLSTYALQVLAACRDAFRNGDFVLTDLCHATTAPSGQSFSFVMS